MTELLSELSFDQELPPELEADLDKYANQGGLLGLFTYFLIYLQTADERTAETAAAIPACLFVMSSLHDDAIDGAGDRNGDLKQFLNQRTTVGDMVFTHVLDLTQDLPESFDVGKISDQFRKIGAGQISEANFSSANLTEAAAIARVEERGSVWGELAISPVEASGEYSDGELDDVDTLMANFLFVLTVVDDVEDIPEDVANDVINIPLILHGDGPEAYDSEGAMIDAVLESDVPDRLDALIAERETEMEDSAHRFYAASSHSRADLFDAWQRALAWYRDSVCTVPVERNVPADRQAAIYDQLTGGDEQARRDLVDQVVADFPARFELAEEFGDAVETLPATDLAPAMITMIHIEALVDTVMTTSLDAALTNVRAASTDAT